MSGRALVVLGGGEHASVLIDAARTAGWSVLGIIDPAPCGSTCARLRVPHLGDDSAGLVLARTRTDVAFVLGVGGAPTTSIRVDIAARYDAEGVAWATVVHARACASGTASVGEGAVVFAGAIVNTGAVIGRHVIVNTAAVIEHDVELGDFVQVAPAGAIGGGAKIGERSYIGLGSRVRDHVTLGRRVTVGMGAVVVRDVADDLVVMGIPARPRT